MRLLCVNWAGIMTLSMACTTPLSATMSHEVTSDLEVERQGQKYFGIESAEQIESSEPVRVDVSAVGALDADEVAGHRPPAREVEEGHLPRDPGAAQHVLRMQW